MLSPKTRRNISRIIPFGLIWLIFSLVYSLLERGLLGHLSYYPATGNPYDFSNTVFVTAVTALIVGLIVGSIEVLYLFKLFASKSFTKKIFYKTGIYLVIIILFLLSITTIYNSFELKTGFFSKPVWNNVWSFFSDYSFWSVEVYIATIIVVSLFYSEVSVNLGHGVLSNFFTGKYHSPVEEERIFMFLDMKSSTAIAENIGHVKYFEMLREYFSDLSDPIIKYSGQVYQYVGDEVVITWDLKTGLQDNNCIECFFSMNELIKKKSADYKERFGVSPEFKAGLHLGKVTTGEIGVIKKEIIFTGDTLNTAARIQSLCNTYQVNILISDPLMIKLDISSKYRIRSMGENELKGRDKKMTLFTILPA